METIESDKNRIVSDYLEGNIRVKEMIKQKDSFEDELNELKQDLNIIYTKMEKALKQDISGSSDEQESTTSIKSEINDKKSDDQTHQIIRLVETKNSVDNLLQDQQQELPQHQWCGHFIMFIICS
jgi:hypothetical protein